MEGDGANATSEVSSHAGSILPPKSIQVPDPTSDPDAAGDVIETPQSSAAANLPFVPLTRIFRFLSIKDRVRCAGVCRHWRNHVSISRFQVELLSNCHPVSPSLEEDRDTSISSHWPVTDVKLKATTPFIFKGIIGRGTGKGDVRAWKLRVANSFISGFPLENLRSIIRNGAALRSLDLSAMTVENTDGDAFR